VGINTSASKQASKKKNAHPKFEIPPLIQKECGVGVGKKKVGKKILLETHRSMQFNVMLWKKTNLKWSPQQPLVRWVRIPSCTRTVSLH
jgi:hypothetical protein